MSGGVRRLARVSRNVSNLAASVAFYCDALGFSVVTEKRLGDPAWGELTGHPDVHVEVATLRLGEQELELVAFTPSGRVYPPDSRSCDLWFQHLAIVVADMDAAYAQLCRQHFTPITEGGPQLLPPNTGSVTAFKFRDPDGHPLELLHFPPGTGDACWQRNPGLFLGVDHSAIAVADTEKSIAFYTRLLGFEIAGRSVNSGPEQARLDRLPRDVRVNVVALQPPMPGPPHLELLGYERPAGRPMPPDVALNDRLADRLILEAGDLPPLVHALEAAGASLVSPGAVTFRDGREAAFARDPDGHWLTFVRATGNG